MKTDGKATPAATKPNATWRNDDGLLTEKPTGHRKRRPTARKTEATGTTDAPNKQRSARDHPPSWDRRQRPALTAGNSSSESGERSRPIRRSLRGGALCRFHTASYKARLASLYRVRGNLPVGS